MFGFLSFVACEEIYQRRQRENGWLLCPQGRPFINISLKYHVSTCFVRVSSCLLACMTGKKQRKTQGKPSGARSGSLTRSTICLTEITSSQTEVHDKTRQLCMFVLLFLAGFDIGLGILEKPLTITAHVRCLNLKGYGIFLSLKLNSMTSQISWQSIPLSYEQ